MAAGMWSEHKVLPDLAAPVGRIVDCLGAVLPEEALLANGHQVAGVQLLHVAGHLFNPGTEVCGAVRHLHTDVMPHQQCEDMLYCQDIVAAHSRGIGIWAGITYSKICLHNLLTVPNKLGLM